MRLKRVVIITSGAGVALILGMLLIINMNKFVEILPFALLLICPVMMVFMMSGHKHK